MRLIGGNNFPANHITRRANQIGVSYWKPGGARRGDVEIWGWRYEIGAQIGHNERMYLLANDDPADVENIIGYSMWSHASSSGNDYYIFRYDADGSRTQLGVGAGDKNMVLFRRNGTYLEVWDESDENPEDMNDWTLRLQVTDTTYIDRDLWLALGEGSNFITTNVHSGWRWFGGTLGGSTTPLPQIIRRTHQRGGRMMRRP